MFPVQRALLLINRAAGTGQTEVVTERLPFLFEQALNGLAEVETELVDTHSTARALTARFVRQSEKPAVVVAGGGGGTLRAVIEGVCDGNGFLTVSEQPRVRVGALRLGSGNVLAKQFGVPREPFAAMEGLLNSLKNDQTVPCCVMRCEVANEAGESDVHHAVTLGGFGQFGRIPSDLARWHARFPAVHRGAARLFGIETFTNIEYVLALLIRSFGCVLFPQSTETIELCYADRQERFRLLSGIMMNFPIKALPFRPHVRVEDEAVSIYLIPHEGRFTPLLQLISPQQILAHTRRITLTKEQSLELRLVDRPSTEFFLDEDPVTSFRRIKLGVAGAIAFVPGPDYQSAAD
jgi:hypothetical protein